MVIMDLVTSWVSLYRVIKTSEKSDMQTSRFGNDVSNYPTGRNNTGNSSPFTVPSKLYTFRSNGYPYFVYRFKLIFINFANLNLDKCILILENTELTGGKRNLKFSNLRPFWYSYNGKQLSTGFEHQMHTKAESNPHISYMNTDVQLMQLQADIMKH